MKYLWSSLVCLILTVSVSAENSSEEENSSPNLDLVPEAVLSNSLEEENSSQDPDSAPDRLLSSAPGDSEEEYNLSESDSGPELLLSDAESNSKLDYDTSESESLPKLKPHVHAPLEDLYMKYYGNDPFIERCWTPMRELNSDEDEDKMKMKCIEYHKLAKKGTLKPENLIVSLNKQLLKFRTKSSYRSAHIDVVWYGINETGAVDIEDFKHFYITRGLGSDCVFFLTPTDKTAMEFYLEEHVCKNSATALLWAQKKTAKNKKSSGVKRIRIRKEKLGETSIQNIEKHKGDEEEESKESENEESEKKASGERKTSTDRSDKSIRGQIKKPMTDKTKKSSKKQTEKLVSRRTTKSTKTVKQTKRPKNSKTTKKVLRKSVQTPKDEEVKKGDRKVGQSKTDKPKKEAERPKKDKKDTSE